MYSVYALCDPETFEVHYIGCSLDAQRRYANHLNTKDKSSNKARKAWLEILRARGLKPALLILEDNLKEINPGGQCVFDREAYWIAYYRDLGAPLTNVYFPNPKKSRQRIGAHYYVYSKQEYEEYIALGRHATLLKWK